MALCHFTLKNDFLGLEIHLTWFIRLKLEPVVYILYLQLIFLFCIELVIAWDKDIKMIKFTELITLHKFRFAIILIKSWHWVESGPGVGSEIHQQDLVLAIKSCRPQLTDHTLNSWCRNIVLRDVITNILSFYFSVSVFHCAWRLLLIGMLIVFILMWGRTGEFGAGIK